MVRGDPLNCSLALFAARPMDGLISIEIYLAGRYSIQANGDDVSVTERLTGLTIRWLRFTILSWSGNRVRANHGSLERFRQLVIFLWNNRSTDGLPADKARLGQRQQ